MWGHVERRMYRLVLWCAVAALLVGCGLLLRQVASSTEAGRAAGQAGEWWRAGGLLLTQTRWGMLWLVREGILLAIAALLLAQRGPGALFGAKPWRVVLLSAACVGLLLVQASMGHAAGDTAKAWYAVPATALHLLAASLWVGGLLALAVGWLPAILRAPGRRGELLWTGLSSLWQPGGGERRPVDRHRTVQHGAAGSVARRPGYDRIWAAAAGQGCPAAGGRRHRPDQPLLAAAPAAHRPAGRSPGSGCPPW